MDDRTILALIDKFSSGQLVELELDEGPLHLVLRKESAVVHRPVTVTPGAPVPAPAPNAGGPAVAAVPPEAPIHLGLPAHIDLASEGAELITSPIVATFYRSPGPDAPAFVEKGSRVKAGQTICILEAMKMMNHLEAEFDCEILSVKAENGSLVEYGQPLFEVKRL
jgi:acetyl-CoA carboxylase biotin carboxyl carrier protein